MEVSNWKSINIGHLLGSFDVTIPAYGITIVDCALFGNEKGKWVRFPSRKYTSGGEDKHFEYVRMTKERKPGFDAKCLELLSPLMQASPEPANANDVPF